MSKLATLILWALAAVVASATPAPQLRPWVTGWDEPVDPKCDCRFEREGERLTITVPGEGHDLDRLEAPRLLRDVQGDFAVEARMTVAAWGPKAARGHRGVGFVVMTDEDTAPVKLRFEGLSDHAVRGEVAFPPEHDTYHLKDFRDRKAPPKSISLRLQRRGDSWWMTYSEDGREWENPPTMPVTWELPQKLKVGVYTDATAEGSFKAVFDQFKLSLPGKWPRRPAFDAVAEARR